MKETKQRDAYFQAIRGICMCAIILIHCQAYGNSVVAEYYQIVLRQIINFAVATFIFMAGFFAHPYKRGYWNRLKKLLIPYVLWSIFYSVAGSQIGVVPITHNLLTGKAAVQLYYILVLVQLTILTPLLMKAVGNKKLSILILSITPIYLLITSGYRYYTGVELTWMGRDFCAWIIFYYFGLLVKHYEWKKVNEKSLIGMYFITLIISVTEGFIVNFRLGMFSMAIGQINLTTMLYSLVVISLIMNCWTERRANFFSQNGKTLTKANLLKRKINNTLVYIGNISFGIYFCHTFVLRCVSFVLRRIKFMDMSPLPFIQIIQFFLTLVVSVMGICIVQRMDKNRKLCPYIGF